MFERAEQEYKESNGAYYGGGRMRQELLSKRDIILNDKGKIEKVIKE